LRRGKVTALSLELKNRKKGAEVKPIPAPLNPAYRLSSEADPYTFNPKKEDPLA